MNLSAETFQALAQSIKADAGDSKAEPRESASRILGKALIIPCSRSGEKKPIDVHVRELSPSGISILHAKPIKGGQQFILCIAPANGAKSSAILCSVSRWQPMNDKLFV